jgi:diadenosine tetraphosphate (Ap4A) HIT family hydrolase
MTNIIVKLLLNINQGKSHFALDEKTLVRFVRLVVRLAESINQQCNTQANIIVQNLKLAGCTLLH